MTRARKTMAVGVIAVLLACTTACGGGDPKSDPSPDSPSASAPSTSPSRPTPTTGPNGPPGGWEDKYTPDELHAYEAALGRWQRYNELTTPIYRVGKNTAEARKTIREYEVQWRRAINDLDRYYDKGGLRNEMPPSPLWSRATSVSLNDDGTGTVVIEQCTDYRTAVVTKNGKPAEGAVPEHTVTPLIVHMIKAEGHDWKVAELTLEDKTSCAG